MNNITLKFSNITNNGVLCKNPIVYIFGSENVAFPCGDKLDENGEIKLTVPESLFAETCITGVIKCDECSSCPEQEFEVCLCNDTNDCAACQTCQDGICVDLCPGKKCVNNTCCDCETQADCPTGFICTGCNCLCPSGKVDDSGNCVQCLANADCGPCGECINGTCVSKCPGGFVCSNDQCVCPPGTEYDPVSKSCKPLGCTTDANCKECEICVGGECQPIVCPEGYACLNGECVEACKDVTCNNGADCGENCGCLDGKCVPCSTLNCDTGQCAQALGCECNNGKCEPVDNCGQYCDGSTPCIDTNCTCYNNECVSCKNFPCNPDDCSTHYNCGCNSNGECDGGAGCSDQLTLKKTEDCSKDTGCELLAEYATDNSCGCDPIEVKIKHVKDESEQGPQFLGGGGGFIPNILRLRASLYKNNVPYSNYLNEITIGDDELVSGVLKTTITHRVDGKIVNVGVSAVGDVAVVNNSIADIKITGSHVKTSYEGKGTLVTIEVRAVNFDIVNNDCTQYDDEIITTYVLDYTTPSSTNVTLSRIANEFTVERSIKLTDSKSVRRPLFIWSKSNGSSFSNSKFNNASGVYAQSGWFRKEYGVKGSNGSWTDKINNPAEQLVEGQFNELWNNYNYKVTVDCGCKANTATLEKVIFCCTESIKYTIENCGRKITIPPFNVCNVNKRLTSNNPLYKFPEEVQTYFWLTINGNKDILLRNEGGEIINSPFTYTHDTNIETVKFEQRYKGSGLVKTSCEKIYSEDYNGPDFDVTSECGKIVVKKQSTSPAITTVTGKKGTANISFVASQGNTVWTATDNSLKMSGEVEVTVTFQGGCIFTKKVSIVCNPDITATPTDIYAKGECPNGTNPNIVAKVITGFSSAVKFSIDGVNYVSPDTTTPEIKKTFTNKPAGTYTIYAKETINGQEVIVTKIVTILPTKQPTASKVDICGNQNGSITILGGAPQSQWKINGPGLTNFQVALDANGNSAAITIPANKPGTYIVTLVNDPSGATCSPNNFSIEVLKKGGTVTPTIMFANLIVCQGQPVNFKIDDGNKNLTYFISSNTGILQDLNGNPISQLQASQAFNGVFIPSSQTGTSATITITGVVNTPNGECFSLSPATISGTITANQSPVITGVNIDCSPDIVGTYWVYVNVTGPTNSVTVAGQSAINQGGGVWLAQDVPLFNNQTYTAVASNTNGCSSTFTLPELPDCTPNTLCAPDQTVQISAFPLTPTCGQQNVTISFDYSTLGNLNGQEYAWYNITGNVQSLIVSGTIIGTTPSPLTVTSQFSPEDYLLVITTNNGICEYQSNVVTVTAATELEPQIVGPGISPDTTALVTASSYSYSTAFIPGASYVWTLSNSNGSNQPIGTNSNVVTISNFADGPNTINVTVTLDGCTGTASANVNVGLSCPTISVDYIGSGPNTCRNLSAIINNLPSGVTPVSYAWFVDNVEVQSGSGSPAIFDASVLSPGDDVDVTITIAFSNGCTVTGPNHPNGVLDPFDYVRCSVTDQIVFTSITQNGCNSSGNTLRLRFNGTWRLACRPNAYNLYYKYEVTDGIDTYTFQYDPITASFFKQTFNQLNCDTTSATFSFGLNYPQVPLTTFGGDTVDVTVWAYSDEALTILVDTYTETGLVMPASCPA